MSPTTWGYTCPTTVVINIRPSNPQNAGDATWPDSLRTFGRKPATDLAGNPRSTGLRIVDHTHEVTDAANAAKIMLGEASLPNDFLSEDRLTLLTCQCGDPSDGSLTVRLSRTGDELVWDDWAWEHGYGPEAETFPGMPECRFRFEDYTSVLEEAQQLAEAFGDQASSIIRVPDHSDGIRRSIAKHVRGEVACQLDWLDIEVIHPPGEQQSVDLRQLIDAVAVIRDELATAKSRRRHTPSGAQVQRALAAASQVLASPDAFRLPVETLEAVEWLHVHLSPRR